MTIKQLSHWKTLSSKVIHENPFMKVLEYDVVRPDGSRAPYYVLDRKSPFSIIIPLEEDGSTYLVGQFRFASGYFSWEFPMGSVIGKTPLEMAKQELMEETGMTARTWKEVGSFYVGHGHTNQAAYIYTAKGLTQGKKQPEASEFLTTKKVPIDEVGRLIAERKILDGPTIAAYQLFIASKT